MKSSFELVRWFAIGVLLAASGWNPWDSWQWWAWVALFIVLDKVQRN